MFRMRGVDQQCSDARSWPKRKHATMLRAPLVCLLGSGQDRWTSHVLDSHRHQRSAHEGSRMVRSPRNVMHVCIHAAAAQAPAKRQGQGRDCCAITTETESRAAQCLTARCESMWVASSRVEDCKSRSVVVPLLIAVLYRSHSQLAAREAARLCCSTRAALRSCVFTRVALRCAWPDCTFSQPAQLLRVAASP